MQEAEAEASRRLPPLGPGSVLRLKPPKAPAVVEVRLGSGSKQVHFPEAAGSGSRQQSPALWDPLQAPPRSGYLFEQHLQRLQADPPPQLLALVEARRQRGRQLAAAREQARQEAAGELG